MNIEKQSNRLSWIEVWIQAIIHPTTNTYEQLSSAPRATRNQALFWVGASSFVISLGFTLLLLSGMIFNIRTTGFPLWALGIPPLVALLSIFWLSVCSDITQFIATRLGGSGSSDKLAYAMAAFLAPLMLMTGAVCILPFGVCLTAPLGIYGLFLNLTAIRGQNRLDWRKALLASLPMHVINIVLIIVMLALLGPTVKAWFTPLFPD